MEDETEVWLLAGADVDENRVVVSWMVLRMDGSWSGVGAPRPRKPKPPQEETAWTSLGPARKRMGAETMRGWDVQG